MAFPTNSAPPSKFKAANGQFLTRSLFVDFALSPEDRAEAMFTLKDDDVVEGDKTYPALSRLYEATADPTEYAFAKNYFHSFAHWDEVSSAPWMKKHITRWRLELETRLRSAALRVIVQLAGGSGKEALTASKYIVEGGWKIQRAGKGAPSKADIAQAAFKQVSEDTSLSADMERLGLN